MWKKLRDKKGVALEFAIFMMVTMFSFCTILYVIAIRQHTRDSISNKDMRYPVTIEQFGEHFYYQCMEGNFNTMSAETFKPNTDLTADLKNDSTNHKYIYRLTSNEIDQTGDNKSTLVLEVIVDYTDSDNLKISKWYYLNQYDAEKYINKVVEDYEGEISWE